MLASRHFTQYIRPHVQNEQGKECLQCESNVKKHTNCIMKRPKAIIKQCTHINKHQ